MSTDVDQYIRVANKAQIFIISQDKLNKKKTIEIIGLENHKSLHRYNTVRETERRNIRNIRK